MKNTDDVIIARTKGKKRKMKKWDQLFRHKLLLPDSYFACPPGAATAAAAVSKAKGGVSDGDGVILHHEGFREHRRGEEIKNKKRERGDIISSGESNGGGEIITLSINHQATGETDNGKLYPVHQQNDISLWEYSCEDDDDNDDYCDHNDGDEFEKIGTNRVDIDHIGDVGGDDDDSNNHCHNRSELRQQQLEIQSKKLPRSNSLYWSCGNQPPFDNASFHTTECSDRATTRNVATAKLNHLDLLRQRVERADVIIQSKTPSYIEFRAKRWGESQYLGDARNLQHGMTPSAVAATVEIDAATTIRTTSSSTTFLTNATHTKPMEQRANATAAISESTMKTPSQNSQDSIVNKIYSNINNRITDINPIINYRTHETFFAVTPRLKSYATTKSAKDFLIALHCASIEASSSATDTSIQTEDGSAKTAEGEPYCKVMNNGSQGGLDTDTAAVSTSSLGVMVEFLNIITESRMKPQNSPFYVMKKVWSLILSVASRCKNGTQLANKLASNFDAFLPEGYSMMSSNLLFITGHREYTNAQEMGMHTPNCNIDTIASEVNVCARITFWPLSRGDNSLGRDSERVANTTRACHKKS